MEGEYRAAALDEKSGSMIKAGKQIQVVTKNKVMNLTLCLNRNNVDLMTTTWRSTTIW